MKIELSQLVLLSHSKALPQPKSSSKTLSLLTHINKLVTFQHFHNESAQPTLITR